MKFHPIELRKHNPTTDFPLCTIENCTNRAIVTHRLDQSIRICENCYKELVNQPLPYHPQINTLNFILYLTEQYEETWRLLTTKGDNQ